MNFGRFIDQINLYQNHKHIRDAENKSFFYILVFDNKNFCNLALKKISKRYLNVYDQNIFLYWTIKFLKFFKIESHLYKIMNPFEYETYYTKKYNNINKDWGWSYPIHLNLTKEETKSSLEILEKFNLKKNDKWICIHNRDQVFKKKTYLNPKDELEHSYRNFDINLMLDAAEHFASLGYFVFRMGREQEKCLKTKNKKIIDYAFSEHKSALADIYFLKNCTAYFGSNSGISTPCILFKRPISHINYATTTLNHLTYYKTLPCIIKRIRCKNSGNKLSIREILEKNLIKIVKNSEIVKKGYELIDNEKVDIKELAVEVGNYLDGSYTYSKEEEDNLERFNDLIIRGYEKKNLGMKKIILGKNFLSKNLDLIN